VAGFVFSIAYVREKSGEPDALYGLATNNPNRHKRSRFRKIQQALRRPKMKTLANRLVMFAASAVVLGTMAYGQTKMKAEIPFAFSTVNATLPAGSYEFSGQSTTNTTRLWNAASHRGVLAVSAPLDTYRTATGHPSIVFVCGNEGCSLKEIRTSNGTLTYQVSHRATRDKEAVSVISIPLTALNGE
jgi:hypothetical protein